MAGCKEILTQVESIIDPKFADVSENQQRDKVITRSECENVEGNNGLSEELFAKLEQDGELELIVHHEELKPFQEWTLPEVELQLANEIAQSGAETVQKRLDDIYVKYVECNDRFSACFQHIREEMRHFSMLRNWSRIAELQELLSLWVELYGAVLRSLQGIERMTTTVRQHPDCVTKKIVNDVIRACNILEDKVIQIMSS